MTYVHIIHRDTILHWGALSTFMNHFKCKFNSTSYLRRLNRKFCSCSNTRPLNLFRFEILLIWFYNRVELRIKPVLGCLRNKPKHEHKIICAYNIMFLKIARLRRKLCRRAMDRRRLVMIHFLIVHVHALKAFFF